MEAADIPALLEEEAEILRDDEVEVVVGGGGRSDMGAELEQFRQQWKEELKGDEDGQGSHVGPSDIELQARQYFLMGSKLEQEGALYEAVEYYRLAMRLVPDIEMKLQYLPRSPRERQESESSVDSFEGDVDYDLWTRFQNIQLDEQKLCSQQYQQRACHISALPVEVLIYIFKWVVSSQLDMKSLESLSQVCRGFYLCARDEGLWRLACLRVWGASTGKMKKYGSWRNMYVERPHVQCIGCYISKMSYYRPGERSLDNYSTWHHIEYHRYLRFFTEGVVLMFTSPEEPLATLTKLKSKHGRVQGMMKGVYKHTGSKVTGVLKRVKSQDSTSFHKYKRNKTQVNQNETQQTFHMELEVKSIGKRNGYKLEWVSYSVRTINKDSGDESVAEFELDSKSYPPLTFSRVKSFYVNADSPLQEEV